MSMLWALRRWLDPGFNRDDADRKRQQRVVEATAPGGEGAPPAWKPQPMAIRAKCRLCGRTGNDQRFCVHCLAETMQPAPGKD